VINLFALGLGRATPKLKDGKRLPHVTVGCFNTQYFFERQVVDVYALVN
jgi:hypothetical protein